MKAIYLIFLTLCILLNSEPGFSESTDSLEANKPLKVLHLTFHKGCYQEIESLAKALSFDLTTWFVPDLPFKFLDGTSHGNVLYNITDARAERIWQLHKEEFEKFDVILTSDTAPLSRIFLQNGWAKPLIIWICNRFDYCDSASLDGRFPDPEYYQLFKQGCRQNNVSVIGYTPFEHYYAKTKGIHTGHVTIRPCVPYLKEMIDSGIPSSIKKEDFFFLPPYHNETQFMDLSSLLHQIGIQNFCGRYNGPMDLKDFKGIIHLPYSWSNLAFFENIALGIPYFIPTERFLEELVSYGNYFHPNLSCLVQNKLYALSEWYCPEHRDILVYFDSWDDLKEKIQTTNFLELREKIRTFAQQHRIHTLGQWQHIFNQIRALNHE